MFIAQKLKKENICEYLLYMWQTEDILRALQLDIDRVNETIVQRYRELPDADIKRLYEWYESLMDMMRRENLHHSGHLQINQNTLAEVTEFHHELLKTGKKPAYNATYYALTGQLLQLRKKSEPDITDIELCLNFLYGIILLKLKNQEITAQTLEIQKLISGFLHQLAVNFNMYQNGELTLVD